ncbi:MAG: AarF/ABC1/UbiB kinase family protein [Bacteroidetes bacterium]|nr:AarF/ABC1/UbiB kinase family protein [Bacteroidota bacterium]
MIRKIGMIGKTYRHANRYLEIIKVLTKYGFEDIISQSGLESVIDFGRKIVFRKADSTLATLSRWERMRLVLEELGPTFIKFGQIMSTRPDLIPLELILELKKLQDSVPPFSEAKAVSLIEHELGKLIAEIFKNFSPTPVAAASIAQVHKATLIEGEEVAVKVQRPGIDRIIETDLEIMFHLATMMEKHVEEMKSFNIVKIVEEFEKSIHKELNFSIEASSIERFGNNFQKDLNIYVPKCYRNYSTKKILTMEFIEGIKISDIESIQANSLNRKIIAKRGADLVLKQIFEYGFFHADPHPGNIWVLPENVICFLDFGMMGTLTRTTIKLITSIAAGAINHDIDRIIRSLLRLCETNGEVKTQKLELQITELIDRYFHQSLEQIDMAALINDLIRFFPENNLKMPSDLYLLGRSLLLLQGNGEMLDPDYNVANQIEPYLKKMIRERLHIRKIAKDLFISSEELVQLTKELPFEIREIIEKVKNGTIKMDIEHKGLNPMLGTHEQISNRITFAIVLASIIIGSSLIVLSKIPPMWNDIPVIGLIGFLAATILGFWLLISIFRHGKM